VSACLWVCVRALKGNRLELSTPNLVDIECIAVARHALTLRSKGQRSRAVIKRATGVGSLHVGRTAEVSGACFVV